MCYAFAHNSITLFAYLFGYLFAYLLFICLCLFCSLIYTLNNRSPLIYHPNADKANNTDNNSKAKNTKGYNSTGSSGNSGRYNEV